MKLDDPELSSERMQATLASLGQPLSEEIARMHWAFPDDGRRERVRAIAFRVAEMERELEQLRCDVERYGSQVRRAGPGAALCTCQHRRTLHDGGGCRGLNPDFTTCGCAAFGEEEP